MVPVYTQFDAALDAVLDVAHWLGFSRLSDYLKATTGPNAARGRKLLEEAR